MAAGIRVEELRSGRKATATLAIPSVMVSALLPAAFGFQILALGLRAPAFVLVTSRDSLAFGLRVRVTS